MNKPVNSSGLTMSARSRSQKTARAPRRRAAQTNLKLIHGDGQRPQVIGPTQRPPPTPLVEWPCPRVANLPSTPPPCVTSSDQRYDETTTTTMTTRRRRRRTTTVHLRVEGPMTTATTNLRRRMNGGQPFGYILLPLIAATFTATLLALVSVQTFAFAAVHATNELQQPPALGHPQQQVDARLIPQANKKSDVDGDAAQREKIHWTTNERATLVKRSNADQLSSAELPAEFRGDEQPREQSRLARLCQQTSSVLASVLPAPFGGHKRSILCQFFGQVQVGGGGGSATGKQKSIPRPQTPQMPHAAQYPIPGVSLPPGLQFPLGGPQFEPAQESIAILHQHQQPPIAILATGKHPIQMVLEHQQRQAAAVANQMSTGWSGQQLQDLNVESSIQEQRVSLQEFAKPPPQKQIKFSAPLATSPAASSVASSPQISSSGWRISNGTSSAGPSHRDTPSSSTTPMPRVNQTAATPTSEPAMSQPKTGAVQLSIGKRTSETAQKSTPAAVRIQPSTSAAKSKEAEGERVRTIEVSAQEVAAPESPNPISRQSHESGPNSAARPSDARQVQKREELVIASINNLTRIAFGNQLRDTVKVINKLIDQQAAVFGQHQQGDLMAAASTPGQQDPMLTSESVSKPQATLMMIPSRPGDKTQDLLKATAAEAKLSINSNKASEHGKVTLTSPKLSNSGSSTGSAGSARDKLKTTAVRSQQQQQAAVASESKLGQRTGNNINNKQPGEGGAQQAFTTTRQERISSSAATNKLRSATGASKLTTGLSKMATSVAGQKSASASNKKVTQPPSPKKQQAIGGSTRTSPKSAKESTQRKAATNHLHRTTAKFSQGTSSSSSGTPRDKDRKQQQNQSTTASLELRRLTTIGRALLMQNDGQHSSTATATATTPTTGEQARAIEGSRRSNSEMDLAVAQTINELTRPVTVSTWLPSRVPGGSSTSTTTARLGSSSTLVMRKLHKIKESSHDELESRRHAPAGWTSTTSLAAPSSWSQAQSLTVTQFPWLLPDKSALASSEAADLFSASSNLVSPTEVRAVKPVDAHQQFGASSPTTRRMVTPYGSDQFSSAFTGGSSSSSKHTPLVLNRIETTRPDSLTTLKMALTRAKATSTPQPQPTPETTLPTRSTRLPFSAGTTQSRWLPSSALLTRQPATTTTTAIPAPTTSSSSPAVSPSASSTFDIIANSYGSPSTVSVSASSANDETRASETISKYTTHLSDQAANEGLMTTAAKRGHFQQPLPQIANTGDYFNAETIASWPEKYHTMVSQAMSSAASQPAARTTAIFETTRRNGETYETPAEYSAAAAAAHTTLSRHRLDAQSTQAVGETTRPVGLLMGVVSSNAPGITILPANHKLMAASVATESESSSGHDLHLSTRPMDTPVPTEPPTPPPPTQTKQPRVAPYTLARESTMPTDGGNSSSQEQISQTTTTTTTTTTGDMIPTTNSTSSGVDPMRPPYHANYDFNFQQLSDPTLVLDQNQSRPYVSKKLYELLVPGGGSLSQSFAGAAHPARSQRFNWSALKYLAQNLLIATQGRQHNATNSMSQNSTNQFNHLTGNSDDDDDDEGANDTEQQQVASKTGQQQLYDLMTRSSLPPLSDYYELAGNESAAGAVHQVQEPANQLNGSYQGKGLFERASNLLSDMKQLEQKRAAALMAALRYQVPGPLIKPWDPLLAQAAHHSSASISKFLSDRLDNVTGSGRAAATFGGGGVALSPTQLLNALKSALFKQKLVARDELEARLKSGRRADQISPERRGDDDDEAPHQPQLRSGEKQIELSLNDGLSPPGNSSITLDDLEYILAANETAIGQDAAMDRASSSSSSSGNSTTLLKTMLARLFNSANSSSPTTNSSSQPESDFHLIDLSANDAKMQTNEASRPKYIRLLDYQTALTRKPLDDKARRMFAPSGGGGVGDSGGGSRQAMAEVIARLRTPAMGAATTVTQASIEFERGNGASKGQAVAAPASESDQDKPATDFDCEGRSAGFYPDASSLCRNFYHCSNTGHLLTFNCPTSTRFDEKSLKCGPWYEVSCNIGRVRTRRH